MQQGSAIVKVSDQINNLEFEPIGESSVMAGAFTDDPIAAGVLNSIVGISLFAGSIMIGGGVIPAMLIAAGTAVTLVNDFAYIASGNREYDLASKAKRQPRQVVVENDQPSVGIQDKATAVVNEPVDQSVTQVDDAPAVISPVDYILGDRLRCLLLVAVSGGGKDLLLAVALREFLQRYQDFNVIVMDCKDDPKEYAYYDGLPRVEVFRTDITAVDPAEAMDWIDSVVQTFVDRKQKTLLICNEGTSVRSISKRYADVVSGLVSNGDSRQMYVWEAGQSGHTDDLKTNGAARSRFRALVISLQGEEMQIEAILQAKWLADSAKNMGEIKAKMLQSPVKRAWSDGQTWFPMARLENHSGYDRDTRTTIGTPTTIQTPNTVIQAPETQQPKVDAEFELLITMLAATMRKAQNDGKALSTLTPEKLTQHQIGKKINLNVEKATIALNKAKALLGVI